MSPWIFDHWARRCEGRSALWAAFAWSAAEALFWPFMPDVLLAPLVAGCPRQWRRVLIAGLAGMALGGIALVLVAATFPAGTAAALSRLPLVAPGWLPSAQALLHAHGAAAFLYQPYTGVPFKAWAVGAGTEHLHPGIVIPFFIIARASRLLISVAVGAMLGRLLHPWMRRYALPLAVLYLALFLRSWMQVYAAFS